MDRHWTYEQYCQYFHCTIAGDMDLDDILLVVLIRIESKNDNFKRIFNAARDANRHTMDISDEGTCNLTHCLCTVKCVCTMCIFTNQ